jgi:hypothetical protein
MMQVNLKLFLTAPSKNKTILLIVIRDRTKTPHAKICADMRRDLDTIWASLVKPPEYAETTLEAFFELQYVTLPSYELEEDDFKAECTLMRRRFLPDSENTYIRSDNTKVLQLHPSRTGLLQNHLLYSRRCCAAQASHALSFFQKAEHPNAMCRCQQAHYRCISRRCGVLSTLRKIWICLRTRSWWHTSAAGTLQQSSCRPSSTMWLGRSF